MFSNLKKIQLSELPDINIVNESLNRINCSLIVFD